MFIIHVWFEDPFAFTPQHQSKSNQNPPMGWNLQLIQAHNQGGTPTLH